MVVFSWRDPSVGPHLSSGYYHGTGEYDQPRPPIFRFGEPW